MRIIRHPGPWAAAAVAVLSLAGCGSGSSGTVASSSPAGGAGTSGGDTSQVSSPATWPRPAARPGEKQVLAARDIEPC